MIPTEYKLHKQGFTVLRTVKHPAPVIYKLTEAVRLRGGARLDWEKVSVHKSNAAMLRELAVLLKDKMTVVTNETDRNRNDKLVAAGLTIIRLENDTKRIKKWYSNQAWRIYEKYDSLEQAKARYDELLMKMGFIEG